MAKILDGKEVAKSLLDDCARRVSEQITSGKLAPKLAVVSVGDNSSNLSYIKSLQNKAADAGILFDLYNLDDDTEKNDLIELINELNEDDKVSGILLMRPLPSFLHDDETEICETISADKDIDSANALSVAGAYLGSNAFGPCTAESCMAILHHYDIEIAGKHAVVIGRSLVVGKPVANMLLNENATVTICHSKTENMEKITRSADIVIVATGTAKKFDSKYFCKGQVVIDAGINYDTVSAKVCGDVDFESVKPVVSAITPVPGGVGSVTTAISILHVLG